MKYEASTGKKVGYVISMIINGAMLYFFNNLSNYDISFLSPSFEKILWAVNLSLSASIFVNFVFMFFDVAWFHHLMQALLNVFSWLSIYFAYTVFPFNLPSDFWTRSVRYGLIFLMVVIPIAILVEVVQFFIKLAKYQTQIESK